VFADGAKRAAGGLLIGATTAFFVARWVTQITGDRQPIPWLVWVFAPAVLVAAIAMASVFPARDAMAVDPLSIMRK
jgi:ABC-type lipoprotein release transport system permease subunit